MKTILGLVGFGTMGSAIYERAKDAFDILVHEKDTSKVSSLAQGTAESDLRLLVPRVAALVIAVKPQDFPSVMEELKPLSPACVISIAAGVTTSSIESRLPGTRVVRVMPNLPARIGKGMSCIARGKSAKEEDMGLAEKLFRTVGQVLRIDESMMNAATAISGSGPGFFFEEVADKSLHEAQNYAKHDFEEQLAQAAMAVGFLNAQAHTLARQTTAGSLEMLRVAKLPAATLRDQVTSRGGTTEAGLKALRESHSLVDAAKAAAKRAAELAQ